MTLRSITGLYLGWRTSSHRQTNWLEGDTVVVYGQITSYTGASGTTLEVQKSQLVSITGHKAPDENSVTVAATDMGFEDKKPAGTFKLSDGTTLTFDKADGTTAPAYYAGSYAAVRLYAKNTLTITAGKKIASITITAT
jgi:hypothetical protein